jgi:hypothetical protein
MTQRRSSSGDMPGRREDVHERQHSSPVKGADPRSNNEKLQALSASCGYAQPVSPDF